LIELLQLPTDNSYMHLRPKTVRRLMILGLVFVMLSGVVGTIWAVNRTKAANRVSKAREDAMAAFEKGDYAAALPHFSTYLTGVKSNEKIPGDTELEAILAFGKSRQAVPMPRGRHLVESIQTFERYLQFKPGVREVQHLLLELYPKVKYNEEALNLATQVLEADPEDVAALRAKVIACTNQHKFKEALAAAETLVKIRPADLQSHAHIQSLMIELKYPPAQILAQYEAMLEKHPKDPSFELLVARAHHFNNDTETAAKFLKDAASRNTSDPDVAAVLTSMLEKYNLFTESNSVLERLAESSGDSEHLRPLVRRLWQTGRDNDVLKRTDTLDPASALADTDLLAYRSLALYDLNRPTDGAAVVQALAARKDDMAASAWAKAVSAKQNENLTPRQRARQYQDALEDSPGNEVIHYFLGEAYAALSESEPALQAWHEAARLAPSWSAPAAAVSRMLAATGRSSEALAAARDAFRRAPRALSTTTGYIVAWFADQQQNPDPAEQKRLLELVEKVHAQIPGEPETLHIYASLLSRSGQRPKAVEVIQSAMKADAPPPRDTLLALAAVSFTEKLGLESAILDFAQTAHGIAPNVSVRKAVLLAETGKPKQGLELLEKDRKADTKTDPALWSLAVLQYRESIDDPSVLAEWIKLGDSNADNTTIQSAILRSPSRMNDKAFWHRSIDRLKKLTGDEAVVPYLERARWLLTGDTSQKDASEAIVLLRKIDRTGLPEVYRMLGIAHEKSAVHVDALKRNDLLEKAVEELKKAFESRNADVGVASDLMRVYRALGRDVDADRVMARIADRAVGVDERKRTAQTLIRQGQLQKAIDVLEPIGDAQDVARDAILAGLYRRTGNTDRAAALYRTLLADQRVDAAAIADGADYFATRAEAAETEKFLAKLRSMDIPQASRELLLARHADRHGLPEEAQKSYEAAVAADPAHPDAWQSLVGFHLRRLQFPEALASADRGLKAIPDDSNLQSLRARAIALQSYKNDLNLGLLANQLSNDPQSAAATELLRILGEARRTNEPLEKTLPKIREVADRNPDLMRWQTFVAQGYAKLGQYDEAERVASRAALRAPNDAEVARTLTMIYAARPGNDKWSKVLDAARQWRQRSLEDPMAADVMIARTLIEMRRPGDAMTQLKPHVGADFKPEKNPAVLEVYSLALIRSGDEKQASTLLLPLAKTTPAWRRAWLQLGVSGFENGDAATRWIEEIVSLIGNDHAEHVVLAEAWSTVGAKFSSETAFTKAKALIDAMIAAPQTALDGWRLSALLGESSGEMARVTTASRKLLEAQPDNADLRNNLAYALLVQGRPEDLPEAKSLIEAALIKSPRSSTYLDTLARIRLRSGDLAGAGESFQQALDAEQTNVDAMIGLADVHAQAGRKEKARELMVRINDALPTDAKLADALQRQLDGVREAIKGKVESGRAE
jgi:Flp pilus assembly protein TadD